MSQRDLAEPYTPPRCLVCKTSFFNAQYDICEHPECVAARPGAWERKMHRRCSILMGRRRVCSSHRTIPAEWVLA